LQRDHVETGDAAELFHALGDRQLACLQRDDLLTLRNLLAQRRFPDRGGDDIAGQHHENRVPRLGPGQLMTTQVCP